MKIRKLSDEELKKGIKLNLFLGVTNLIFGVIFLLLSMIHWFFGFLGLGNLLVGMWLIDDNDFKKIILEIRHQKNNGVDKK